MDLSRLIPRKSANTKNGTQNFDLKFRRYKNSDGEVKSYFEMSDKLFNDLELGTNGLIPMVHPDDTSVVILRVVPQKEAVLYKPVKNRDKSAKRQSSVLENDLVNAGVIQEGFGNQFLTLESVEDEMGHKVEGYYMVVNDKTVEDQISTDEDRQEEVVSELEAEVDAD